MTMCNRYLELRGKLEKELSFFQVGDALPSETEWARRMGVSCPTLRRALAELEKDGLIVKKHGVGNFLAKSAQEISKELFFLCSDFRSFSKTLQVFCDEAAKHNYFASIIPLGGNDISMNRIVYTAMCRKPAGMVVLPLVGAANLESFQALHDSGIPTVYLIRKPENLDENLLENSSGDAIAEIVRLLYRQGRRKFAFFGDNFHTENRTQLRLNGFLDGLKSCRVKVPTTRISVRGASPEKREAFFELFRSPKRPDTVCCCSDGSAAIFIHELRMRGIDTDSLLIAGFDKNHVMPYFVHDFITAELDQLSLGRNLTDMLIRQIDNPGFVRKHCSIPSVVTQYCDGTSVQIKTKENE